MDIGDAFLGPSSFLTRETDVGVLVELIAKNALIIAALVLLAVIIISGYSMLSGAGSSNPQEVARGKQMLTAGIIGFIIILAAYWIAWIVEQATGLDFF